MMFLLEKLKHINKFTLFLICLVVSLGFILLYDAAGGSMAPWSKNQIIRFGLGFCLMMAVALTPLSFWLKYAYGFYFLSFFLLVLVLVMGHVGMGAQRWLNLGFIKLQPSELMRVSLILALACYFHRRTQVEVQKISALFVPGLMILLPTVLILKQPDLGTAILTAVSGGIILFVAGIPKRVFGALIVMFLSAIPVIWQFLRPYQKKRILTFLYPERDPFGSGYHIMQSKIALGSGGFFGKGFMAGTQSHLNFLPEKQTDFIFTLYAEEFGFLGSLALIVFYGVMIFWAFFLGMRCQSVFARLISVGLAGTLFLYVFINIAMVTGVVPVVGVPLPFLSYGGTAMWSLLISFGFILNADLNRTLRLQRYY